MHIATVRDAGGWGDVCCCMWAQAGLRLVHPHSVLHWWGLDQYRDLAERCPDIDRRHTINFARRRPRNAPISRRAYAAHIPSELFERVVDLFCPCPIHEQRAPTVDMSRIELFCQRAQVPVTRGRYLPTVADRQWLDDWLGPNHPRGYIMFAPFAQSKLRCWNPDEAVKFATLARSAGVRLLYVDSPKPRDPQLHEAQKALTGACTTLMRAHFWQVMVALEACDLYVGADTGPIHAAGLMGVPILGLFGMTGGATTLKHYAHAAPISYDERPGVKCHAPCYTRADRGFRTSVCAKGRPPKVNSVAGAAMWLSPTCSPHGGGQPCMILHTLSADVVLAETIRKLDMIGEEKCESQEVACTG